jgi:hypothetical protein
MPYGASQVDRDELALVRAWIAAGAPCAGVEEPDPVPAVASIAVDPAVPISGQLISITVTLDRPAPAGGQMVSLATDPAVLSAPTQMLVPASAASIAFEAYALRPSARFALQARTAGGARELVLRVGGLEIAEVVTDPVGGDDQLQWIKLRNLGEIPIDLGGYRLAAGQDSYGLVAVSLAGVLAPGGCAVIGGPLSSAANGHPVFAQAIDFAPDLPHGARRAAGFAVLDAVTAPLGGVATPVDAVVIGAPGDPGLLDPDGLVAPPACAVPAPGSGARRTGAASCTESPMQPGACP